MIERTVVIADIHGCIDEFKELLNIVDYKSPKVKIICLGDFLDRGIDPIGCIKLARKNNIESVMGNHEYKFIKWLKSNGKTHDKNKYYLSLSGKDIAYIKQMPISIKLDKNTIAVHAGLRPGVSLSNQSDNDLMHIRYIDFEGNFVSLHKIRKIGKNAAGAYFWTEFWKGPESIIYGHNVASLKDPLIEEVSPGVICYGLDTGCVFGGHLTALILETKEIIKVKAKRVYYERKE